MPQYVRSHRRRKPGRHRLTQKEILRGQLAALKSPRTPAHLKKGLRAYLKKKGAL